MDTPTLDRYSTTSELVKYIFARREAILQNWRVACEQDPALSKVSVLSREEFNDLLPIVLDILEQRLLNQQPEVDLSITAKSHGLHRWQKALALAETIREINHLTKSLFNELQAYLELFPQTDARVLLLVQEQIVQVMNETMHGSVKKYDELQRLEAANRVATLQQVIDHMEVLSRQRGDILRTSSHDLRGSFGIINSAAYLLKAENLSDQEREKYTEMLSRNLTNAQSMLDNLMALARLEAGEETLQMEHVNASELLRGIVEDAQPMATQRGLVVQASGPDSLLVETDKIKLQRIVQNLLVNSLTYTARGFVSVSWSQQGDARWVIGIQDSGPGLPPGLTGLLVKQLKPTVDATSTTGTDQAEPVSVLPDQDQEIPPGPTLVKEVARTGGEGVGLQIVKRLCDLLDANLEIESQSGRGTLFRIRMAIRQAE
ncbi:sensor histidine kinase [Spirosoma radiotolerans]|uniref:histidine kinase n=1 Tax=Spirosoma radiotolerans TaxID=1379870 RepID=A0A0E3V9G8_9BACT|nr:HAMP domain-containing sensor histidine kinase [Spirosoma radiotolerans]AKD57131.1 histidine kinase [Spirosoma radiotolerans]